MAEILDSEISCGARQLTGVREQDPKDILLDIFNSDYADNWYGDGGGINVTTIGDINFGMILFSDRASRAKTSRYKYGGVKFADYVTKNGLGKIIASDIITNPNTNNKIQTWIWQLDRAAIVKWVKANGTKLDVCTDCGSERYDCDC